MSEMRGNWCRRSVMHSKAEHDLVYPADREVQLAHDRAEEQRQADADNRLLERFVGDGMTEDQAADELWRWMAQGRGLVEPGPRP